MYLPDDLWIIIIKYQTIFGDYNPSIFNKQYLKNNIHYNKKISNWKN